MVLSGTVLFFASQQAFQPSFVVFVMGFVVVLLAFLTLTFLEDGFRGARVHWAQHRPARPAMLPYWLGVSCMVVVLSGLAFWLMSRGELNLVGPAQLTVLPYPGASLAGGYELPEFGPADLISFPRPEDPDTLPQDEIPDEATGPGSGAPVGGQAGPSGGEASAGPSPEDENAAGDTLLGDVGGNPRRTGGGDTVFFVRTKVTSYWRGRTLEHFDGRSWATDAGPAGLVPSTGQPGVWYDRDNMNRGSRALYQQTFYVQRDDLDAIITGYNVLSVEALAGSLDNTGVQRGTTYRVLSAYAERRPNRLRRDSTWVASRHLVSIPADSETNLRLLAGRITRGAASDFEKVERIVGYLQQGGAFDAGWLEDPTATAQLDGLLFEGKPGNAMDYATATVMLARASGLPARLAAGYLPGARDPFSGAYAVKRRDAHTWAEVYFANQGWVPFDSSPRGNLPSAVRTGSGVGLLFRSGVGDTVFGAVKSAQTELAGAVLKLLRNPVLSIVAPLLMLVALVLRWLYTRQDKGRTRPRRSLEYKARLAGEDRRELLSLYGQLERLLRRKPGIRREPWQTVAGFTGLATAVDPRVQSQLTWFTRAVWHAAYDPRELPSGLVEEARRRLRRISTALRSGGKAAPAPQP